MLIEFKIKNYKCFKDEQTLSMVATSDEAHPELIIKTGIKAVPRLLKIAAIYGANGSGKTKILEALHNFRMLVAFSVERRDLLPRIIPFVFDTTSKSEPTFFEITFIQNGIRYQYGVTATQERVVKEWLLGWPKGREVIYFQRSWLIDEQRYEYYFGPKFLGGTRHLIDNTREDSLILSVGEKFNHPLLKEVCSWFITNLEGYSTNSIPLEVVREKLKDIKTKENVIKFMSDAGIPIDDYELIERRFQEDQDLPTELRDALSNLPGIKDQINVNVIFFRKFPDGGKFGLPIEEESEGTSRIFSISAPLLFRLSIGGVIYFDELDASFHPLLSRAIVELFGNLSENCRNSQLIFNTHDTTLLDQDLLRRDQIWLIEKDNFASSHIYCLSDFSPRKGEALAKGYLQGRYGAIPYLTDFFKQWPSGDC